MKSKNLAEPYTAQELESVLKKEIIKNPRLYSTLLHLFSKVELSEQAIYSLQSKVYILEDEVSILEREVETLEREITDIKYGQS